MAVIFVTKTSILYFLTNLALSHAPILSRNWCFYHFDIKSASSEKENVTIQERGRCIVEWQNVHRPKPARFCLYFVSCRPARDERNVNLWRIKWTNLYDAVSLFNKLRPRRTKLRAIGWEGPVAHMVVRCRGKSLGKTHLWTPKRRWEYNMTIDFKCLVREDGLDWSGSE